MHCSPKSLTCTTSVTFKNQIFSLKGTLHACKFDDNAFISRQAVLSAYREAAYGAPGSAGTSWWEHPPQAANPHVDGNSLRQTSTGASLQQDSVNPSTTNPETLTTKPNSRTVRPATGASSSRYLVNTTS